MVKAVSTVINRRRLVVRLPDAISHGEAMQRQIDVGSTLVNILVGSD